MGLPQPALTLGTLPTGSHARLTPRQPLCPCTEWSPWPHLAGDLSGQFCLIWVPSQCAEPHGDLLNIRPPPVLLGLSTSWAGHCCPLCLSTVTCQVASLAKGAYISTTCHAVTSMPPATPPTPTGEIQSSKWFDSCRGKGHEILYVINTRLIMIIQKTS